MKILISGSSGLIGSALSPALRVRGHELFPLVRRAPIEPNEVQWHAQGSIEPRAIESVDAVIHLAGRNVATRWTERAKREIFESRVTGTRVLSEAIAESFRKCGRPRILVSASAIGFYGNRQNEILTEQSSSGGGFLAEVVRRWEDATIAAREAGVRVVMPRIGMVLSREGGALAKMLLPFKLGLGGRMGSGEQWMSWITLTDLVRIFLLALDDEKVSGIYNAVTPQPVKNRHFVHALGSVLQRPVILPLPAFAIKTIFGRMGVETILGSSRVIPVRLQDAEFYFEYPEIEAALRRVLGNQ
ncbi:MAG TPA: TIGR01777 family oxidoreductase [Terriglobales bacterium]